jgi:hypothetical protein
MVVRNCKPDVSRLCGRACVSWAKRCKGDPPDPGVPGRAPRRGGRRAAGVVGGGQDLDTQFDQRLLDAATRARIKANEAPWGTARRRQLEEVAILALVKAVRRPALGGGATAREANRLLREAQAQYNEYQREQQEEMRDRPNAI